MGFTDPRICQNSTESSMRLAAASGAEVPRRQAGSRRGRWEGAGGGRGAVGKIL